MHQAVNVLLQADERAEARELGDVAGDEVADLVILVNVLPRILAELLDADRDALVRLVHFQHDRFDFVASLQDLAWVVDLARPRDVGHVNHAVQAFFQFDESAIAGEVANLAFDPGAGRIFFLGLVPRIGFELADAQRNLLLFAVDAEHNGFDVLAGFEDVARLGDAFGQESSVTWMRPSTPGSSSTKAP